MDKAGSSHPLARVGIIWWDFGRVRLNASERSRVKPKFKPKPLACPARHIATSARTTQGIVLDAWRYQGRLYWGPVRKDPEGYPWKENKAQYDRVFQTIAAQETAGSGNRG